MKFWLYLQQRELAVLRTESEKWVCRFFGFSPGSRSASVGLNRTKTESETEPFSVGFSSNPIKWSVFRRVRCACVGIIRPLIVWCQMTLLQYLPLLRHTVQAGTSYPSGSSDVRIFCSILELQIQQLFATIKTRCGIAKAQLTYKQHTANAMRKSTLLKGWL